MATAIIGELRTCNKCGETFGLEFFGLAIKNDPRKRRACLWCESIRKGRTPPGSLPPARPAIPGSPGVIDWSWSREYRKPVPDFPGYSINTEGVLWTHLLGKKNPFLPPRVKTPSRGKNGYLITNLVDANGRSRPCKIHVLVMLTFLGPRPPGMMVCHNDGNPANNSIRNLRWGTWQDNFNDAVAHGTASIGSRSGRAKLTEVDIMMIRRLGRGGVRQKDISRHYGVSKQLISRILQRGSWRHVPDEGMPLGPDTQAVQSGRKTCLPA
jgi:hypothetical protein